MKTDRLTSKEEIKSLQKGVPELARQQSTASGMGQTALHIWKARGHHLHGDYTGLALKTQTMCVKESELGQIPTFPVLWFFNHRVIYFGSLLKTTCIFTRPHSLGC